MAADTFFFHRVTAVEGCDVVFEVKPSSAIGLCDRPAGRGFFAMLLADAGGPLSWEQAADRGWLAAHIDEHIVAIRMERVSGCTSEPLLRDMATTFQIPIEHLQPCFTFRVTMADEARASCFRTSSSFMGTTAYDAWADPRAAAMTSTFESAPPFAPITEDAATLATALHALLPGWTMDPAPSLELRSPGDIALRAWVARDSNGARPGFELRFILDVSALHRLERGPERREVPSPSVVSGTLSPAATRNWIRAYVADDDSVPATASFVSEVQVEDTAATLGRLARALRAPAVDALLTPAGVIGLVEQLIVDQVAQMPAKKRPADHVRLGTAPAPALGPRWVWTVETPLWWQRIAVHAALGSRDDARKALAQARAVSKKPPKELKGLIAALDGEAESAGHELETEQASG